MGRDGNERNPGGMKKACPACGDWMWLEFGREPSPWRCDSCEPAPKPKPKKKAAKKKKKGIIPRLRKSSER